MRYLPFILTYMGFISHIMKKIAEIKRAEPSYGIKQHLIDAPYMTISNFMGLTAVCIVYAVTGVQIFQANPYALMAELISFFFMGFSADSIGRTISNLSKGSKLGDAINGG